MHSPNDSVRLRIAIVSEPGVDGVFRHVEGLTRFLLSNGIAVDLAYSSVRSCDRLLEVCDNIRQANGTSLDLRVCNAPQLADAIALGRLVSLVHRSNPSVIHCHSSKAGILGRATGSLTGIPTVYTPHAYYGMGKQVGARTALFNGLERLFSGLGHTVHVSEGEAEFARHCLGVRPPQQSVIPNPVNTDVFKPAAGEEKKRWRRQMGLPTDAVIVGTLGRLSYQKDPLTLYRAFKLFAHIRPDTYLAHLGSGDLAGDCQQFIEQSGLSSRVLRIDYAHEPSDFYRALNAFALSSRYEGLSFAVLEAMATNLPLVLTDVPGNRDFFKLGLSHLWTAPAEHPAAFAQAIEQCMDSLGNGAPCNHRKIAVERFSEEACFGRILDLYRHLAAPRRTSLLVHKIP